MSMLVFARRNTREILRDPLNLAFGVGFPVVVLLLLTAIQHNIPVSMFELDALTPGIAVFGLSFLALFSAMLVSKDRGSAFLDRLLCSPLRAADFILGYLLPMLPMALAQGVICYAAALLLGLTPTVRLLPALAALLPCALVFLSIGLLCGSLLSDKQASGVCGALLTNLSAWLSGTWFSLDLVGGAFRTIANLLPFAHSVELGRAMLSGSWSAALPHLWWVLGWAAVLTAAAIFAFRRKTRAG